MQRLKQVYERILAYLTLRPGPLKGCDSLFATTACYDREGNVVTAAGKRLSTRAIHLILMEELLLAGVKKPDHLTHVP